MLSIAGFLVLIGAFHFGILGVGGPSGEVEAVPLDRIADAASWAILYVWLASLSLGSGLFQFYLLNRPRRDGPDEPAH